MLSPEQLGEWNRKIVEVYMQWYTYHVAANLLIMGWFHSKDIKTGALLGPVAKLFQGLNVLGAISTGMVGYFVSDYFVSADAKPYAVLIRWSAFSNGLALLGIAYVWGLVIPKKAKA